MTTINKVSYQTDETSKLKNYGKGVLTNIKLATPFLSEHTTGDYYSKMTETVQN